MISDPASDLPARIVATIDDNAVFALDPEGYFSWWNPGAERMTGLSAGEVLGTHHSRFYEADDVREQIPRGMLSVAAAEGRFRGEGWRLNANGERFWASITLAAMYDDRGTLIGYAGMTRDLTESHQAELELRKRESQLRLITEAVTDAIVSVDATMNIVSFNGGAIRLYGWAPQDVIGRPVDMLIPSRMHDTALAPMRALAESGPGTSSGSIQSYALHRDGHEVPVELSFGAWTQGGQRHLVGVVRDITERMRADDALRHMAEHDALTNLYNRRHFEVALARFLCAATGSERRQATLLVLDLDGFKEINDRHGHAAGDEIIRQVGALLDGLVRQHDIVGRMGGDEFAILLVDADLGHAERVAAELIRAISGANISRDIRAQVTVSIGIAELREPVQSAEDLLEEADSAMYAAKAEGRNRHSVYRSESASPRVAGAPRSWLGRLDRASEEGLFQLWAQPIIGTDGRQVEHLELLLRLCDEAEPVPAGAFLGDAERFDRVGGIDRWVFGQAVALLHRAHRDGRSLSVTVNLSARTMTDATLVGDLAALCAANPFAPGQLVVEVAETSAVANLSAASTLARELRTMGCRFALDAFGSGFASLLYLKHLSFDFLKIDGEFITGLVDSPADRLIVAAVVQIAHGMGARTIATCVPDSATMDLLGEMGVDCGQGFYLGEPVPLAQVLA